jgi:hypothetical protein
VKRHLATIAIGVTCFVLGATFQKYYESRQDSRPPSDTAVSAPKPAPAPAIPFDREPLWAYGFETPAKPEDKAPPQAPPTRNLRPNEDPAEQTRPRRVHGSRVSYSLVDVRDGHATTGFRTTIRRDAGDHTAGCRRRQHGAWMRSVICRTAKDANAPPAIWSLSRASSTTSRDGRVVGRSTRRIPAMIDPRRHDRRRVTFGLNAAIK